MAWHVRDGGGCGTGIRRSSEAHVRPKSSTNFPYNDDHSSQSSSTKFLSATLTAKLQRCHMASLQMAAKPVQESQSPSSAARGKSIANRVDHTNEGQATQGESGKQFNSLEDDHIEQMIQELLDYGSVELSSVMDC